MTLQQLIDLVKSEQFPATDNRAGTYPLKFFNYGVFTVSPFGVPFQRNPEYCGTAFAATQLAQILGATQIISGLAMTFTGSLGGWSDTEMVPFLILEQDGKKSKPLNVGQLMVFFVHGYPESWVAAALQNEVKGAFENV